MAEAAPDLLFLDVQRARGSAGRSVVLALALLVWIAVVYWLLAGAKGSAMDFVVRLSLGVLCGVYVPLDVLFRRIEIRVQGDQLELRRFVPLANRSRTIPLDSIERVALTRVYPAIDWTPWSPRGASSPGVQLRLRGGEHVFISTPRPEALAAALPA